MLPLLLLLYLLWCYRTYPGTAVLYQYTALYAVMCTLKILLYLNRLDVLLSVHCSPYDSDVPLGAVKLLCYRLRDVDETINEVKKSGITSVSRNVLRF